MRRRIICFAVALVTLFTFFGGTAMSSMAAEIATLTLTHNEGGIIHFGGETAGTDVSTMQYPVGAVANFQVEASAGYYIQSVNIGGAAQAVNANATVQVFKFTVTGNTAIQVTFVSVNPPAAEMTVICHTELGNGTVLLSDGRKSGVFPTNSTVTVNITPGNYYAIDAISLDGIRKEVTNGGAAQSISFKVAPNSNTVGNTINVIVDFKFTGVREYGNINFASGKVISIGSGYKTNTDAIMLAPGSTVANATADICEALCMSSITVTDSEGASVASNTVLKTGMKIIADRFTYNVIIGGDVNADGSVDVSDAAAVYSGLLYDDISGVNCDAALLTATNKNVTILDVMATLNVAVEGKRYTLGKDYMPNVKYLGENGVDFAIDFAHSNDIKILQLTDTQIEAMNYIRTNQRYLEMRNAHFDAPEYSAYEQCYKYIKNSIEQTNPDFIVLTGDNIYGETDDTGLAFQDLIDYIDSFEIPWAATYGNHDNESAVGVLAQNKMLINSKYCVFRPGTVTGNSNYNIALRQNGKIKYMLYMGDTNGTRIIREDVGDGILSSNPDLEHVYLGYGIQADAKNLIISNMDALATANGSYVPSLLFIHIQTDSSSSNIDSTFMSNANNRNLKGVFFGHTHTRNYGYTYSGTSIYCAYGVKTGTYDESSSNSLGGRLITVSGSTGAMSTSHVMYNGN